MSFAKTRTFPVLNSLEPDATGAVFEIGIYSILIDREDLERVKEQTWYANVKKHVRFRANVKTDDGIKKMTLAAFLMHPPEGTSVVHRAGADLLDYRKSALEVCDMTTRQAKLSKSARRSSSIYKGVSKTARGKWRASIRPHGLSFNLGEFHTEEEAALAYNRAAIEHFGPSAFQNSIKGSVAVYDASETKSKAG